MMGPLEKSRKSSIWTVSDPYIRAIRSLSFSHLRRNTVVHQLLLGFRELAAELCVALESLARNVSRLDRLCNCTARLGQVRAVVEATPPDIRSELGEALVEILRWHSPHPHLPEAGRIHDVPGVRQRMQHSTN